MLGDDICEYGLHVLLRHEVLLLACSDATTVTRGVPDIGSAPACDNQNAPE